jgi:hypothetical protein
MTYSEKNWPKIKKPGSMEDPVFAAFHMANIRWMKALNSHYSFTDPERNVRLFKKRLMAEAESLLEVMGRNQRTKPTKGWKPYMIVDAVHRYACPATRLGDKSGPCVCGAAAMMKEFKSAWAKFRKAVKSATK